MVRHEHRKEPYRQALESDAVQEMKVWPFEAALWGEASNHHMLRER